MVYLGKAEVVERHVLQPFDGLLDGERSTPDLFEKIGKPSGIHGSSRRW